MSSSQSWPSSHSWLFWQAALEAASRTVLRCTLLNDQLLNHYPSQNPNFFEVACSIQKVVGFKGRINVQLPYLHAESFVEDFGAGKLLETTGKVEDKPCWARQDKLMPMQRS